MATGKNTSPGKRNSPSLKRVAGMLAKGEDPDTLVPVWTEYISGLAAAGDAVNIDRLVSQAGLQALRSILDELGRESIEETNEDKKYYLKRLQEFNTISAAIQDYMYSIENLGANPVEETPRPAEMLCYLKILRHTALTVMGSNKTSPH